MKGTGWVWALVWALAAAPVGAEEDPVIEDVLVILRERGIVDEAQYTELLTRHQRYEEEHASLLGRIELSGDLRVRLEHFSYDDTALDEDRRDRTRGRYRLRLDGKAEVNDYVDAVFQIASGQFVDLDEGENRSTNRTFGASPDFSLNPLFISRAYIQMRAPSRWLGEDGSLSAMVGKTKNPFLWKGGQDYLLWDHDINPEGVAVQLRRGLNEDLEIFSNAGYFVVDENGGSNDPHLFGVQLGVIGRPSDTVELGARGSFYDWRSLDGAFRFRNAIAGNLPDGLGDRVTAAELAAYLTFAGIERWPLTVYGHIAQNFAAEDSVGAGKEDLGWMVGAEIGDRAEWLQLGVAYTWMEANFWPARFTDSDFLDGFTNRRGFAFYGARRILPNTDLVLEAFVSEPIRRSLPAFAESLALSERVRLRADLIVKF